MKCSFPVLLVDSVVGRLLGHLVSVDRTRGAQDVVFDWPMLSRVCKSDSDPRLKKKQLKSEHSSNGMFGKGIQVQYFFFSNWLISS